MPSRLPSSEFHFEGYVARLIPCGEPEPNERQALDFLSRVFDENWALFANIPRHVVGREIDACLLGPRGMIVLELKNYQRPVTARLLGPWDGIVGNDKDKNPIEQAEKGAQALKSYLVARDSSLGKELYVDSAVVLTHEQCRVELADNALRDRVSHLNDVLVLVERRLQARALQHNGRRIAKATLEKIFSALSLSLPAELALSWSRSAEPVAAAAGARPATVSVPASTAAPLANASSARSGNILRFPADRTAEPAQKAVPPKANIPTRAKPPIGAIIGLLALVGVVIFIVIRIAPHGGEAAPAASVTRFAMPQTYVVVPGRAESARERSGPGTNFSITKLVARGTRVLASGTALDSTGAAWIALADGSGFLKLSTVRIADYTPPKPHHRRHRRR